MNENEFLKKMQKQNAELDKNKRSNTGTTSFIQIDDEFPKIMAQQDEVFVDNMKKLLQKERSKEIKIHIQKVDCT